jgi:hypothetical protein
MRWLIIFFPLLLRLGSGPPGLVLGQCDANIATVAPAAQMTLANTDYYIQTAKGLNTNNEIVIINGVLDVFVLSTVAWLDLRATAAAAYTPPTTTNTVTLISSSTSDTAAGVGCQTVRIDGLNAAGNAITDTVTMATTPASSTPTVNVYSFINRLTCITVGTTLRNVGAITVSAGPGIAANRPTIGLASGTGLAYGLSRSTAAAYRVPNGKSLLITGISADTFRTATTAGTFAGAVFIFYSLTPTGPQIQLDRIALDQDATSAFHQTYDIAPILLPAGTTVWVNAIWYIVPSATDVTVTGILYS